MQPLPLLSRMTQGLSPRDGDCPSLTNPLITVTSKVPQSPNQRRAPTERVILTNPYTPTYLTQPGSPSQHPARSVPTTGIWIGTDYYCIILLQNNTSEMHAHTVEHASRHALGMIFIACFLEHEFGIHDENGRFGKIAAIAVHRRIARRLCSPRC